MTWCVFIVELYAVLCAGGAVCTVVSTCGFSMLAFCRRRSRFKCISMYLMSLRFGTNTDCTLKQRLSKLQYFDLISLFCILLYVCWLMIDDWCLPMRYGDDGCRNRWGTSSVKIDRWCAYFWAALGGRISSSKKATRSLLGYRIYVCTVSNSRQSVHPSALLHDPKRWWSDRCIFFHHWKRV